MRTDASRDAFEAWWKDYSDEDSDKVSAKDAWQASRKQALDEATEVCIRVISSRDGERIPKNAAGAYECHDKIKELK